jgi:hypothetical protein
MEGGPAGQRRVRPFARLAVVGAVNHFHRTDAVFEEVDL